jgi:hypothetical protein
MGSVTIRTPHWDLYITIYIYINTQLGGPDFTQEALAMTDRAFQLPKTVFKTSRRVFWPKKTLQATSFLNFWKLIFKNYPKTLPKTHFFREL